MKSISITFLMIFSISHMEGRCSVDSLKLTFKEKVISISKENKVLAFTGKISNLSKQNLILYGFRKTVILDSSIDSMFFNDIIKNGGAGNVLVLLDISGKRKEIHVDACADCAGSNNDSLHDPNYMSIVANMAKHMYRESAEIIPSMSKKEVGLNVSLSGIPLQGEYKIFMIYYCGRESTDIVGMQAIKNDEHNFKAHKMTGWVKSDTIKLIIK